MSGEGEVGTGEGTSGWIAVCSLRSVSLTCLRPASMYYLVLSISCVSRKHTMPPKPAMMAAWLGKAKEGEFGTVIHSPAALATLNDMRQSGQVQRSSLPLVFSSICQSTKVVVVQVLIVRRGNKLLCLCNCQQCLWTGQKTRG